MLASLRRAGSVLARRRVPISRRLSDFSDAARPLAARIADSLAQVKQIETRLDLIEKEEVIDLLLGFVKRGELTHEQVMSRLPQWRVEPTLDVPVGSPENLRFGVGQTVECRMGADDWGRGTIIGLLYREADWPQGQVAPYQVLLEGDNLTARTIWAPADNDECIRSAVRFAVGSAVECRVGVDQNTWVRGTVVAHYYREANWPATLLAPYRVLLDGATTAEGSDEVYLWAPVDAEECIRAAPSTPPEGGDATLRTIEE